MSFSLPPEPPDGAAPEPQPLGDAEPIEPIAPNEPKRRPTNVELRGPRPAPSVSSLAGTAAGIFLVFALLLLLDDLGDGQRMAAIGLSLVFEVAGVALLLFATGRRSSTAGGTLAGIAIIPLLGYTFAGGPTEATNPTKSVTGPLTTVLVLAAVVWFAAWFFGPGRRYAFFLGAACLALWLAVQVQVVESPLEALSGQLSSAAMFTPLGPSGSSTYDSGDFDSGDFDGGGFNDSEYPDFEDQYPTPKDPSTKLGVTSLLFGCAYLVLAGRRDKVGDGRAGTALFAAAAPILFYAVGFLSGRLHTIGTSILAIALGSIAVWLGTRSSRRFTSWVGTTAVILGVVSLVGDAVNENDKAGAAVFVVLGLALAIAATTVEGRGGLAGLRRTDPSPDAPEHPDAPTDPSPDAPATPVPASTWSAPASWPAPPDPSTSSTPAAPPTFPTEIDESRFRPPGPGQAF